MLNLFKKNPYKCKYLEITWEYPIPEGAYLEYKHKFTNKPQDFDRRFGNGGRGYECFNLDDKSDINKICRLNYGYKKQNYNKMYIPQEIITLCVNIHDQRRVNNVCKN